jgi:hypothetical protein
MYTFSKKIPVLSDISQDFESVDILRLFRLSQGDLVKKLAIWQNDPAGLLSRWGIK